MSSKSLAMTFDIDPEKSGKPSDKFIDYGTCGFRSKAEELDHVLYRTGMLSVLRSKKNNGKTIGLMITASHNPDCDNGVKVIDSNGDMMEHSWEILAADLINAENNKLEETVKKIVDSEKIDLNQNSSVFIGQDTRSSSPKLAQLAKDGILALGGNFTNYGLVTTPVLHYMVYCMNKLCAEGSVDQNKPTQADYNKMLVNSFNFLNNDYVKACNYGPELIIDCANGVGALKVKELMNELGALKIRMYNNGNGILNHNCGADFVKVNKRVPEGIPIECNVRCVSLDGDADRLIYFYVDDRKEFHMLDGDRIATLITAYLMELVRRSNIDINLGIIQTAYANGNATKYVNEELKVPVSCVRTGVKHLHEKAKEYDIGVYFEANGHGTVLFSEEAEEKIKTAAESKLNGPERKNAAQRLMNLMKLINQTVGDAISDVLLVETILKAKDWSLADWEKCYVELPNRLRKVAVKDRNIIKTSDADRICVSPEGLQEDVGKCCGKYRNGRAFVRASGTEDVVRVYAEASTQAEADDLALKVASLVYNYGGVGDPPV